jgi:Mrp family chromosome partitioning ATPase
MPNLKASDFDYIIFDMPPLTQTSPTLGMSGFMDKMLMVVEAEGTSRETVKRSYRHLVVERKNVSVVFNKARSYTPRWLDGADATEG